MLVPRSSLLGPDRGALSLAGDAPAPADMARKNFFLLDDPGRQDRAARAKSKEFSGRSAGAAVVRRSVVVTSR
jgi:hypothetical protein